MTLLPTLLYTDKSRIHGTGVFAGVDLPARLVIPIPFRKCDPKKHDSFEGGVLPKAPFCFLNHSKRPNCEVYGDNGELNMLLLRPVKSGRELTIDYGPEYWRTL